MYIYKITVVPLNQCYIGFDTKPSYKLNRWKTHCQNSMNIVFEPLFDAKRFVVVFVPLFDANRLVPGF